MIKRLKNIRLMLNFSINAFAKALEMPYSTYAQYENETNRLSVDLLERLYKKFNINANYIISGEGTPFINSDDIKCNQILPYEKASLLKETIVASIDKILLDK